MRSTLRLKRNRVWVKEPHVQSLAALVLLEKDLADSEVSEWLEFRLKFLNSHELICHYCGRDNLKLEVDVTKRAELKELATIDHVVPISKGGAIYDEDNCVVACFPCNQKKGDRENFNPGRHRREDTEVQA